MKRALVFLTLLVAFTGGAQVSIGRSNMGPFKDFRKNEYDQIKQKTTIFVVQDFDLSAFDMIARKVWTLNKYQIISREEYDKNWEKYLSPDHAIMVMTGSIMTVTSSSGMTTEYLYVYYDYFYPTDIKQKKNKLDYDRNQIASIFFGGDTSSMWEMVGTGKFGNLEQNMYNYRLGYMKNYLQLINDQLTNEGFSWVYGTDVNKKKIKDLNTKILYIPEYLKIKSIWGWTDKEREDPNELFKKYTYKYEFISDQDLQDKILNTTEDFYYLMYTKINSEKLISVVNGRTGEVIYRDYQAMSYQLKTKDLTELASKIKKA